MGKAARLMIVLLLISSLVFGWNWARWRFSTEGKAIHAVVRSQGLDQSSLARFEEEAKTRILTLERNVDAFVDDLTGLTLIWKTVTFKKDQYIKELWEKHFCDELQRVLPPVVEAFISDVCAHHNSLIVEVSEETGSIMLDTFVTLRVEEDFHATLDHLAAPHIRKTDNILVGGQIMAMITGMVVGKAAQEILRNTWIGIIVGIVTDLIASNAIEEQVKRTCRDKVRNALEDAATALLYGGHGSAGLVPVLEAQLDKLHEARMRTILMAVEQNASVAGQ